MNKQLASLYEKTLLKVNFHGIDETHISPPLLLSTTAKWVNSNKRILVIGQETLGWEWGKIRNLSDFKELKAISSMIENYERFSFGENYRHKSSPFWKAFRLVRTSLSGSENTGFESNVLWTNLFRSSYDGGSFLKKANLAIANEFITNTSSVLIQEIALLQPTEVIFFTGPNYDKYIKKTFQQVTFKPLNENTPLRELAKIEIPSFNASCYRTYHPNYLQRSKKFGYINTIINDIK
ncbi:hypothetical protein [Sulfurimonas sp. HSL3-7]|uniref:hypothetical protein n=1 Tax=Sulfonitrofixus jiaomeiensis TaxID=3131938 RepID=UPI0031F93BEF